MSGVFISYSHEDREFLHQLKRHFSALKGKVEFWDDSMIYAGMKWQEEIEKALKNARVAILLVSADFFNSTYIMEEELPYLLQAQSCGTAILSVIIKPCLFDFYPQISKFQAVNSPSKTVIQMSEAEKEILWTQLILRINELLK
ncbi:MAG: toll/interleukin receptor protein [Mucilaginibacter sp.]|nr:toll/interleukin receptor protein [Mucilaginibacter sp.]